MLFKRGVSLKEQLDESNSKLSLASISNFSENLEKFSPKKTYSQKMNVNRTVHLSLLISMNKYIVEMKLKNLVCFSSYIIMYIHRFI